MQEQTAVSYDETKYLLGTFSGSRVLVLFEKDFGSNKTSYYLLSDNLKVLVVLRNFKSVNILSL